MKTRHKSGPLSVRKISVRKLGNRYLSADSQGNGFFASTAAEAIRLARRADLAILESKLERNRKHSHARRIRYISDQGGEEGEHDWRYQTAWVHPAVRDEARHRATRVRKSR
jgi:hypothetical protein